MVTATDTKPTQEKALAIPDRRQELKELVDRYPQDRFILLSPSTEFGFSPMFRPVVSEVRISVAEGSKDVYAPGGGRRDEVALHATALKRISNALAITWEDTDVEEVARWKWRAHAAGWILHPNGDRIRHTARYVLDVSDEAAVIVKRIRAKVGKQMGQRVYSKDDAERDVDSYRQFGEQRAETGAKSRVIQDAANLQKTYSVSDLAKRVFAAMHWRPDERHPQVAQALLHRMASATEQVFGTRARAREGALEIDAGEGSEDELYVGAPIDARQSETPAPQDPEPVEEEQAAPAVDEARAIAIRAHVEQLRSALKWGKDAREKRPTAPQAGLSVTSIAAAIAEPKQLNNEQKKLVWRAVMEQLFGAFGSFVELDQDKVSVSVDWAKQFPAEVRELVLFLAQSNERIQEIHTALHGQQTSGIV